MASTEEIEKLCRNCVSRDFITGRGLVCKRTSAQPNFKETCEHYQKDEALEKIAPTPHFEEDADYRNREQLLAEENISLGVACGAITSLVCAVAWAFFSISVGYQLGIMAIGMGYLVGFAMRRGKGIRAVFGIIGAILALAGCVLGDFLSIIGLMAKEYNASFLSTLASADYKEVASLLVDNVFSTTALFYGFAAFEGYKYSFRKQKGRESGKI